MTNYATTSGIYDQTAAALQNSTALGQAYDASKTDDSFYLPPEAFSNPEFQRGLKLFLSPDGKAARMIITHDVDPATPEGISHIDAMRHAAQEAVKGTPLAGSKIYIGGTASTYKDIAEMAHYDLIIAAIAALSLILLIMMFITRSLVAALVIVGTVALSLGASFGLSVLVWQHLMGVDLYWVILPLAVILLLAVGSDYNLLLVSRFKEEIHAGINTGIIRSMAGSGSVVTAAGLVFAFTMASFIFSDLLVLGQIGTTIALGLLFDTLIVRSFMTPSIAALLGRWFWWPVRVRQRPSTRSSVTRTRASCRCSRRPTELGLTDLIHRADACAADRHVDAHRVRDESVGRSDDQVAPVEREAVCGVGGAPQHVADQRDHRAECSQVRSGIADQCAGMRRVRVLEAVGDGHRRMAAQITDVENEVNG